MKLLGRRVIQILFLALFIFLFIRGKVQLWMAVFLAGVLGAFLLGRFYCGWICPINTVTEGIDWLYGQKNIKRREVPKWIKMPIFRFGMLILFIGTMVLTLKTGIRLPVLIIIAAIGSLLTLFFKPALWHRYLCPYGAILSLPARAAVHYWKVDEGSCIKCGICKNVCPGEALIMDSREEFPHIDKKTCLECTLCAQKCPKKTIKYI